MASDDRPIDLIFPFLKENRLQKKCVRPPIGCGGDATKFRDELSEREYGISGLCQKCQDEMFG